MITRPLSCSRLILAITVLSTLAIWTSVTAAERDSLKLLTIGNSFSNDALGYLPYMAEAGGKQLLVGRASIGGCSLERHARHLNQAEAGDPKGKAYKTSHPKTGEKSDFTLPELLSAQPWDIVTLQQWSQLSFKPETFQPFADELIAAIRKYAPTAEIVVHQTWAYREDHDFFKKDDGFTPAKMYADLTSAYKTFADGKSFRVLPVGDAFQLARQTPRWTYTPDPKFDFENPPAGQFPDQRTSLNVGWVWSTPAKEGSKPKFFLDAIHCNAAGKYLAGAVWYLQLFNADALPVAYVPKALTAADTAELRPHALAAVQAERARIAAPAAAGN
ncbi:MAG: hypothetical protein K0R17_1139 [Rariglobus sp.]|jgi:hypothetical protein|nr:hypothetical protein [Rariglobus sp.]